MLEAVNCELCSEVIGFGELYVDVKKRIPLNAIFSPEDSAERGIHIRCVAAAADL